MRNTTLWIRVEHMVGVRVGDMVRVSITVIAR